MQDGTLAKKARLFKIQKGETYFITASEQYPERTTLRTHDIQQAMTISVSHKLVYKAYTRSTIDCESSSQLFIRIQVAIKNPSNSVCDDETCS